MKNSKYLYLSALLLVSFFFTTSSINAQKTKTPNIVEQMPRFPGCEDMDGTNKEKKTCADQKLLEFIYKNVNYPKVGKEKKVEGMSVIRFTVSKEGKLKDTKVLRSLGEAFDAELFRMVNLMNEQLTWIPGKQEGKTVAVQYNLPIRFKLNENNTSDDPDVLTIAEEMPLFPGCQDMEGTSKEVAKCSHQKLFGFIAQHLKYPKAEQDKNTQGMSVVQFIVSKEGTLKDIKMIRSLGEAFDTEVLRVIHLMNEQNIAWIPGKEKGKTVAVKINLPVRFALEGKEAKKDAKPVSIADKMPRFPGCEDMDGTNEEKKACADQKLLEFIYKNVNYPKTGKEKKVEGMTVVSFTVSTEGKLENAKVVRSLGEAFDKELLRLVDLMNEQPAWTAGEQEGKRVAVQYNLPIRFKLNEDKNNPDVFTMVEEMPRFPGCEDMDGTSKEVAKCSHQKLFGFIAQHLKYPKSEEAKNIEGMSIVQFIVTKEGTLKDIKMTRSLGEAFDTEVLRVINLMNEQNIIWVPGKEKGKTVAVKLNLPVRFALDREKTKTDAGKEDNPNSPSGKISIKQADGNINSIKTTNNITAFPSPTTGSLNIKSSNELLETVQVVDLNGRVVSETQNIKQYQQTLDLSELPVGIYTVVIKTPTEELSTRIVKK